MTTPGVSNSRLFFLPPLLSGLLLVVIQPPLSQFYLAYVALVPLLCAIRKDRLRDTFLAGYLTGVVSYLGLIYWVVVAMNRYGGIHISLSFLILLLFVAYLSLYTGCFAFTVAYLQKHSALPIYVTAPILWVIMEYLRGFLLSGFPWSFLAHSQHNFLALIQIVSVTGSYFISFLIVSVNCIIFCLLFRKPLHVAYAGLTGLLLILSLAYGFNIMREKNNENLTAAIIQGNITQDLKWQPATITKTIEKYFSRTIGAGSGANLVIWPETALPFQFNESTELGMALRALSRTVGADLLFGAVTRDKEDKSYNSAYLITKDGNSRGHYSKVHLVPFGEYTPFRRYLPFLEKISVAVGDFFSGPSHSPLKASFGDIGVLICYEGVFPGITNETVRNGAQVLVNMTNDAWFGSTSAPYQHLAFYVFRAIETDRYVLRAANTGISAIIDNHGHVRMQTPLFRDDALRGGFEVRRTKTWYAKYGDYFVLFLVLVLILTAASARASARSRRG